MGCNIRLSVSDIKLELEPLGTDKINAETVKLILVEYFHNR